MKKLLPSGEKKCETTGKRIDLLCLNCLSIAQVFKNENLLKTLQINFILMMLENMDCFSHLLFQDTLCLQKKSIQYLLNPLMQPHTKYMKQSAGRDLHVKPIKVFLCFSLRRHIIRNTFFFLKQGEYYPLFNASQSCLVLYLGKVLN